ncbi:MAG: 30S ribosomal protein S6 [Planctomycetes bacterium GWF2_42_9]|nr:MAG: 30S ribosomal protein S6 [Planctomycetes bacterium GWF2_42_9]HAL45850.1 30S ribosomal protein S6 [Phycisphaerales bacterium]
METVTKRLYEALFLVDAGEAASDWQGINDHIKKILEKNGAEILSMRKWDDRPLAYPIVGKKRGVYILVYFNATSDKLSDMEHDIRLSERILRSMILRGDHITQADMDKDTPAILAEKGIAKPVAAVEEIVAAAADDDDEVPGINAIKE